MQNLIDLCKPSLISPRFVAGEVREHEVRRGMCVLWVASETEQVISFMGQSSGKRTPERIRSAGDTLGKCQDKGERDQEEVGSLSDCSAGITPVKRQGERRRILRKSLRQLCSFKQTVRLMGPEIKDCS